MTDATGEAGKSPRKPAHSVPGDQPSVIGHQPSPFPDRLEVPGNAVPGEKGIPDSVVRSIIVDTDDGVTVSHRASLPDRIAFASPRLVFPRIDLMTEREKLPDFLVVGAAKSGTTTLHDVLRRHPALYMS